MVNTIQSMIQNIANVPQVVQNSLDSIKDFIRDASLFGMDATIIIGYLLYIVLFFVAIKGIYLIYTKFKENQEMLSKFFFFGRIGRK